MKLIAPLGVNPVAVNCTCPPVEGNEDGDKLIVGGVDIVVL